MEWACDEKRGGLCRKMVMGIEEVKVKVVFI